MSLLKGLSARLRLLFAGGSAERRMHEEFQFHIEMETERLVREAGMTRDEARRQAHVAFGGTEKYKEELRSGRGIDWLKGLSLDVKLGLRMLVKYPGLTIVGSFALAVAIGAGASYLEFLNDYIRPRLPFEDGDRMVGVYASDANGQPAYATLAHFEAWRSRIKSIEDLGYVRGTERNLITADGRSEPVRGAEITASALRVTRVPPLHGRLFTDNDEKAGAPPVALLGYDVWNTRFNGDVSVVGQHVQFGTARYQIVGIMPERFEFPIVQEYWIPLKGESVPDASRDSDLPRVVGRLAKGITLGEAQKELAAIEVQRSESGGRATPRLHPTIDYYVKSLWFSLPDGELQLRILYAVNVFFIALLAVCGANIATLVFARTATRANEITVRTALGASRARVITQLLMEALVLAGLAALLGLAIARFGAGWITTTMEEAGGTAIPFWWNDSLAPETIMYAGLLAIITALVVGGIPALKTTGTRLQPILRQAAVGGASLKFGRVWTGVIISQVALTVLLLLVVITIGWNVRINRYGPPELLFPADNYLSVRVDMDREDMDGNAEQHLAQYSNALNMLEQRLAAEPNVQAVTHGSMLPGISVEQIPAEVEGHKLPDGSVIWARGARVASDYFDAFNAEFVAGSNFNGAEPSAKLAIVNESFVKRWLPGQNAVGKRIRQTPSPDPSDPQETGEWHTIVGVVKDLTTSNERVLYFLSNSGAAYPAYLAVKMDRNVRAFGERTRDVAATVDPRLRLKSIMPMSKLGDGDRMTLEFFYRVIAIVGSVALLLSTAGVYSLMSFSVARRRREIAIRAALGASPQRLLTAIFSRAFWQLGVGVLIGLIPGGILLSSGAPEVAEGSSFTVGMGGSLAVGAFMMTVGLVACAGPAKRALRIQPTDALRADS